MLARGSEDGERFGDGMDRERWREGLEMIWRVGDEERLEIRCDAT